MEEIFKSIMSKYIFSLVKHYGCVYLNLGKTAETNIENVVNKFLFIIILDFFYRHSALFKKKKLNIFKKKYLSTSI